MSWENEINTGTRHDIADMEREITAYQIAKDNERLRMICRHSFGPMYRDQQSNAIESSLRLIDPSWQVY